MSRRSVGAILIFLIGYNFNGFSHIEQPTPGGHYEKYAS